jgi:carbamate kinase
MDAVIDKDRTSALLAEELGADALLMLTDVDAVVDGWNTEDARRIRQAAPEALRRFSFDSGSMGPKVEAGCGFVSATGGTAGIGALEDAADILAGRAGTLITRDVSGLEHWS